MAIAQLALTSCSQLVVTNPGFFGSFDFNAGAATAFDTAGKRNQILDPLLSAAANVDLLNSANNLTTQPAEADIRDMLGATTSQDLDSALSGDAYDSLINQMVNKAMCLDGGGSLVSCNTTTHTEQIVKAVCAAAVGGAVMLIQ